MGVFGKRSVERQRPGAAADHRDIHLLFRHKDIGSFAQAAALPKTHMHSQNSFAAVERSPSASLNSPPPAAWPPAPREPEPTGLSPEAIRRIILELLG